MDMKWILVTCMVLVLSSCLSNNKQKETDEQKLSRRTALRYCECLLIDTTRGINTDSCFIEKMREMTRDKNYTFIRDSAFVHTLDSTLDKQCLGWRELLERQRKRLEQGATKLANDESYLISSGGSELAGTLLSWKKLPQGENEYEIVVKSTTDGFIRTFISQARPPKSGMPDVIYVTFEPNEAAYPEKYPLRVVKVRVTNKN